MSYKTREQMIAELHDIGYTSIFVKGGKATLETAPDKNLYRAYRAITGRRMNVEQQKKHNQVS